MAGHNQKPKLSLARMKRLSELYFTKCDEELNPYTITGVCLHMDISTDTFRRYGKRKEYKKAVKRIRTRVEDHIIKNAINNTYNSGFSQFLLKSMNRDKYVVAEKTKTESKVSVTDNISPIFKVLEQIKKSAKERQESPSEVENEQEDDE